MMADMDEKTLLYNTRDTQGKEIVKEVKIKEFSKHKLDFDCPICKRNISCGCKIKDIVSSNFTDWAYVGEYVCPNCADLFSLYFYNYIIDPSGIRLLNVRELRDQLTQPQRPPFLFVITTSQKKHLFYRAQWNYDAEKIAVNLETETIYTTPQRMKKLFDFVECLQTLGCSKEKLKQGEIYFPAAQKIHRSGFEFLQKELGMSREIQIPLYCGQKREIREEEAICCINSILTA